MPCRGRGKKSTAGRESSALTRQQSQQPRMTSKWHWPPILRTSQVSHSLRVGKGFKGLL